MLRGFSNFEQMFRAKMAKVAPKEVMVCKKMKDGHSENEIAAYKATFKKFDADGGGAIDAAELGKLIRVLGLNPTDEEIEIIMKEIDDDGSGEIDFKEFLEIMNCKTLRRMQTLDDREGRIRNSFKRLEDESGRIEKQAITKGTMKLSMIEAEDLCGRVEPDEDGKYNTDDFIKILCTV